VLNLHSNPHNFLEQKDCWSDTFPFKRSMWSERTMITVRVILTDQVLCSLGLGTRKEDDYTEQEEYHLIHAEGMFWETLPLLRKIIGSDEHAQWCNCAHATHSIRLISAWFMFWSVHDIPRCRFIIWYFVASVILLAHFQTIMSRWEWLSQIGDQANRKTREWWRRTSWKKCFVFIANDPFSTWHHVTETEC
jgi:hypothetical protein